MPKFARFDPTQPAPSPVLGWYDTDLLHYPNLPDASQLIAVSDDDWKTHFIRRSGWVVENRKLVQPSLLVETPAPRADVQISSASCPGVDGLYACDDAAVTAVLNVAMHIKLHGSFPGDPAGMDWPDRSGAAHRFENQAVFLAFSAAVSNHNAKLKQAALHGTALPPASEAII